MSDSGTEGLHSPIQSSVNYIHLLDGSDSLLPFVNVARSTRAREALSGEIKDNAQFFGAHINHSQLKDLIAAASGEDSILEPDIVLVVGPLFTLAGCPPWHLKESEIYHVGLMEGISSQTLDKFLARYQSTMPRFGR